VLKCLAVVAAGISAAGALAVPALAATRSVALRDDFFTPKKLSIAKNSTIRWVWQGRAPHNVTVTRGPATFRSKTQVRGTYTHRFTRSGSYTIVCTIHPQMVSTVTVR
jgi:plastocyanin